MSDKADCVLRLQTSNKGQIYPILEQETCTHVREDCVFGLQNELYMGYYAPMAVPDVADSHLWNIVLSLDALEAPDKMKVISTTTCVDIIRHSVPTLRRAITVFTRSPNSNFSYIPVCRQ